MINKEPLRQAIISALENNLNTASKAADTARDTATSKETVAENKYDTFGLEASYLAHGQSIRALELQQAIQHYEKLPLKHFEKNDIVELTALVTLATEENIEKYLFLGPEAGGLKIFLEKKEIMIITPRTPLGNQLLGKRLDDVVELNLKNTHTTYEIIAID